GNHATLRGHGHRITHLSLRRRNHESGSDRPMSGFTSTTPASRYTCGDVQSVATRFTCGDTRSAAPRYVWVIGNWSLDLSHWTLDGGFATDTFGNPIGWTLDGLYATQHPPL